MHHRFFIFLLIPCLLADQVLTAALSNQQYFGGHGGVGCIEFQQQAFANRPLNIGRPPALVTVGRLVAEVARPESANLIAEWNRKYARNDREAFILIAGDPISCADLYMYLMFCVNFSVRRKVAEYIIYSNPFNIPPTILFDHMRRPWISLLFGMPPVPVTTVFNEQIGFQNKRIALIATFAMSLRSPKMPELEFWDRNPDFNSRQFRFDLERAVIDCLKEDFQALRQSTREFLENLCRSFEAKYPLGEKREYSLLEIVITMYLTTQHQWLDEDLMGMLWKSSRGESDVMHGPFKHLADQISVIFEHDELLIFSFPYYVRQAYREYVYRLLQEENWGIRIFTLEGRQDLRVMAFKRTKLPENRSAA